MQETVKVEVEDDRRPRWDSLVHSKERVEGHHFFHEEGIVRPGGAGRVSSFQIVSLPSPKADLKTKKAFKEAVLRTDAAGACGLSLVRCGKLAQATLGKESPLIKRMKDACTGESPQDVDSLLAVLRDSLGELNSVKKEMSKVSNVGSKIAAGVFN
jgi:hypothetical protein